MLPFRLTMGRPRAIASSSTAFSGSEPPAEEEQIARLDRRLEQKRRCDRRRRANAAEAKRKREAQRRQDTTPAEQFLSATASFRTEFVEIPVGVTCTVCDRHRFAGNVCTIGGVSGKHISGVFYQDITSYGSKLPC
ncbi:hypothetical protein ISCGN_028892 [Ixodes scapularis]